MKDKATNFIDLTGMKFGKLTVIRQDGRIWKTNYLAWLCRCECGNETRAISGSLNAGHKKSCGCLVKEHISKVSGKIFKTHGISSTAVFASWNGMIHRCYSPNNSAYRNYGGRGIGACSFIKASPVNLKSILGERPFRLTLERMDVNSGYNCGQCQECLSNGWIKNIKWASYKEQARNTRRSLRITIDGVTKCASQWEEENNLHENLICQRIKAGKSGKELLAPSNSCNRKRS